MVDGRFRFVMKHTLFVALFLGCLVFVIDVLTPLGDAVWIFYMVPLLVVSARPGTVLPLGVTALSWLFIALGYLLSPPSPNVTWDVLNRLTGMVVQLIVAVVLIHRNWIREDLRIRTVELEKEITERRAIESELRESRENLMATMAKEMELEDHLRQSQKTEALGTLASGVAHDFNNILTAIVGFTDMAVEKLDEGKPICHYLERVRSAAMRGKELIGKILTFSRRSNQEKRPLRLSEVITESIDLLRSSLPAHIMIRFNDKNEPGYVVADRVQMQQVIINLCTNAAHAIGEKPGVIEVELSATAHDDEEKGLPPALQQGNYARITVRDTGQGMTSEVARRVFDPFFTTKKQGEGTGLGLSIVHGIIETHGGAITVESEPGAGSQFTVYLPSKVGRLPSASRPVSL